jgi:hypothetical protein
MGSVRLEVETVRAAKVHPGCTLAISRRAGLTCATGIAAPAAIGRLGLVICAAVRAQIEAVVTHAGTGVAVKIDSAGIGATPAMVRV